MSEKVTKSDDQRFVLAPTTAQTPRQVSQKACFLKAFSAGHPESGKFCKRLTTSARMFRRAVRVSLGRANVHDKPRSQQMPCETDLSCKASVCLSLSLSLTPKQQETQKCALNHASVGRWRCSGIFRGRCSLKWCWWLLAELHT